MEKTSIVHTYSVAFDEGQAYVTISLDGQPIAKHGPMPKGDVEPFIASAKRSTASLIEELKSGFQTRQQNEAGT